VDNTSMLTIILWTKTLEQTHFNCTEVIIFFLNKICLLSNSSFKLCFRIQLQFEYQQKHFHSGGNFIGLAHQDAFRFIIEYYSSLMDFGPWVIIGPFLYEDFRKMIFWLVLKLEISYYRVIIISWRILVSFRGFLEDYIFAMVKYLSFHNSSSFALRYSLM
jgi:hypothetical protein